MFADTTVVTVLIDTPECNDTLDNDADTLVDYPTDPGCTSELDDDETDSSTPAACADSSDNDGDGKTDYPTDLGCDSASDTDESGEILGIGGGIIGGSVVAPIPRGTQVVFIGRALPGANVTLLTDGVISATAPADRGGDFRLVVSEIVPGTHTFNLYATGVDGRRTKTFSYAFFVPRGSNILVSGLALVSFSEISSGVCPSRGDLNGDCLVDLIDFSILIFWWDRTLGPEAIRFEQQDLNNDGVVDLRDFSILAYYWTG